MVWKDKLTAIEQEFDWRAGINLLENVYERPKELYIRVIFLLLDFVVERQYTSEEHDYAAKKLKDFFIESQVKFSDDAEYLFLVGFMIYIGEWYFGMDKIDPATSMLEKAMISEPNNMLFQWGYHSSIDQRPEHNTDLKFRLTNHLLNKEPSKLDWLRSKGLYGEYIIVIMENLFETLKKVIASK